MSLSPLWKFPTLSVGQGPFIYAGKLAGKAYSSYWQKLAAAWATLPMKIVPAMTLINSSSDSNFPLPKTPYDAKIETFK